MTIVFDNRRGLHITTKLAVSFDSHSYQEWKYLQAIKCIHYLTYIIKNLNRTKIIVECSGCSIRFSVHDHQEVHLRKSATGILVTVCRCWWQIHYAGHFFHYVGDIVNVKKGYRHLKIVINTNCLQHPSPTSMLPGNRTIIKNENDNKKVKNEFFVWFNFMIIPSPSSFFIEWISQSTEYFFWFQFIESLHFSNNYSFKNHKCRPCWPVLRKCLTRTHRDLNLGPSDPIANSDLSSNTISLFSTTLSLIV